MTTLPLAKQKYRRATDKMGRNWKAGVEGKADEYASEMAKFLGIPKIRASRVDAWRDGTEGLSAEDFASVVKGKEEKWARKLVQNMSP